MSETISEAYRTPLPPSSSTDDSADSKAIPDDCDQFLALGVFSLPGSGDDASSSAPPGCDLKARLMQQFAGWLDRMLDKNELNGIADELLSHFEEQEARADAEVEKARASESVGAEVDLYALWSAMTALTQETKLQGRAFKALFEQLQSFAALPEIVAQQSQKQRELTEELIETNRGVLEAQVQTFAELQIQAEEKALLTFVEVLIDLRDRMKRALGAALGILSRGGLPAGLLARIFAAPQRDTEAAQALADGVRMNLDRIDQVLRDRNVTLIEQVKVPFDPLTMRAVELVEDSGLGEGQVVEVFRCGYAFKGRTIRVAEVKVSKSK